MSLPKYMNIRYNTLLSSSGIVDCSSNLLSLYDSRMRRFILLRSTADLNILLGTVTENNNESTLWSCRTSYLYNNLIGYLKRVRPLSNKLLIKVRLLSLSFLERLYFFGVVMRLLLKKVI